MNTDQSKDSKKDSAKGILLFIILLALIIGFFVNQCSDYNPSSNAKQNLEPPSSDTPDQMTQSDNSLNFSNTPKNDADLSYLLTDNSGDVYQSDNETCKAAAMSAAFIVYLKQNGITYSEAINTLKNMVNGDTSNPVFEIAKQIYKSDFAKHLSIKGAYSSYGASCDAENSN